MAVVILPFLGGGVGGSHISSFGLGQSLKADFGVGCLVFCRAGSRIEEEAARRGLEVVHTGSLEAARHNPFYDLIRLAPRISRLLKRRQGGQTIVHCQDIGALQSWGPPAKLLGIPVVYHHRSLNRPVLPNRMALAFADAAISISASTRANLFFVPEAKLATILNPFSVQMVERAQARAEALSAAGAPSDAVLFGFVGNFWERKRPRYFLDAATLIAAQSPRAHFLIYGRDGEISEAELRAYAEGLGLGARTHFLGFRSPPEANIAALDVLLAPALREPFGRTLVEALLLGTPYVATDDAGHAEIGALWGGGRMAPTGATPAEFAEMALAIASGADSPLLSQERRAEAAAELSARRHAEAVLDIYRRVSPGFAT